tara:strand:- start:872 stop:1774 length:903 start_codon:yes stop_codon:yes gene_type:complete
MTKPAVYIVHDGAYRYVRARRAGKKNQVQIGSLPPDYSVPDHIAKKLTEEELGLLHEKIQPLQDKHEAARYSKILDELPETLAGVGRVIERQSEGFDWGQASRAYNATRELHESLRKAGYPAYKLEEIYKDKLSVKDARAEQAPSPQVDLEQAIATAAKPEESGKIIAPDGSVVPEGDSALRFGLSSLADPAPRKKSAEPAEAAANPFQAINERARPKAAPTVSSSQSPKLHIGAVLKRLHMKPINGEKLTPNDFVNRWPDRRAVDVDGTLSADEQKCVIDFCTMKGLWEDASGQPGGAD